LLLELGVAGVGGVNKEIGLIHDAMCPNPDSPCPAGSQIGDQVIGELTLRKSVPEDFWFDECAS